MFRKSLKLYMPFLFLLLMASYFPAVPALAASFDFTDPLFSDCDSHTSCEKTVGGIKIRIEGWRDADPKDGVLDPLVDTPAPLYWKSEDDNGYHDGFGVKTGELDEIERPEFLVVRFLNADDPGGPGNWHYVRQMLSQLNITNLFNENGYLERGAYQLTVNGVEGDWVAFLANTSQVLGSTNGVLNLSVPTPPHSDVFADYVTFTAPEPGYPIPPGENFEFSLAGLNADALYTLSVSRVGTGSGTVTSIPAGINCGLVCTKYYDTGTAVALTATPDAGSTFSGWTGDCDSSGHVTVNADKSCTATFTLNTYTLTITTAGTGSGTTTGAGTYNSGQTASVSASANAGSTFTGWTGSNAAECATGSVLMNGNKICTANFTLNTYTLALTTAGSGSGTVSGAGTYNYGQTASVSASANTGSTFTGWTGPDAAECTTGSVLMNANKSCTANFTLNTYSLTLTTTGSGSGTVSGAGTYNYGQTASVSATANTGSIFTGWTGPNAAECTTGSVLMNADKSCTANFTLNTYTLTINTAGTGSGTSTGGGTYTSGQTASVSATANTGSIFTGWTGPNAAECGTGSVLMNANKGCTANFNLPAPPTDILADLVLCQGGFYSYSPNAGQPSINGSGCNLAYAVAIDRSVTPNRVYVSDYNNNRVLGWSNEATLANGAAADLVIGQPGFTTGTCNIGTVGAGTLCLPMGIAVDSAGNLYVADRGNSRVLVFNSPFTTDTIADLAIGQTDLASSGCSNPSTQFASATSLCVPTGVTVDASGNMYVADMANNRVLKYNAPLSTGMAANLVFGQSNFSSKAGSTGAAALNQPYAVAVDGAGNMYVADFTNNRVLEYNAPLSNGMSANRVFGQPNFTSNVANPGGVSANTLRNPWGVAVDAAGNLYVADHSNNRMLEYDTPLTTNTTADRVFGQPSFTTVSCNYGGLGPGSLCLPSSPAVDSLGDVWVADYSNNRVLEYGH